MMNSLDRMKYRLGRNGYTIHDNEIVQGKYNSFKDVLRRSYQSEWITLNKGTENEKQWRCLISPSRLTEQFDKKIISIDYEAGLNEGSIFYWDRTGEYWLVNAQQWTEEAYFRGSITKCSYEIDVEGKKYWAAVQGPDERAAKWNNVHRTIWNDLNYTLVIQITKDSKTVDYFSRHQVIKVKMFFKDVTTGELLNRETNWRIVATDKFSSDNVMDVFVDEWFSNTAEDIRQEQERLEKERRESQHEIEKRSPHIEGPTKVSVYDEGIVYTAVGFDGGEWKVNSDKVSLIQGESPLQCRINVLTSKSSSFLLAFVDGDKEIDYKVDIESF